MSAGPGGAAFGITFMTHDGKKDISVSVSNLLPEGVDAPDFDLALSPRTAAREDALTRRSVTTQWIKEWDVTTGLSEPQLLAVRRRLAEGHPVACGLRWPKNAQYVTGHCLVQPPPAEVFDGHSIVLVGYTNDARQDGGGTFLFRNSSGPGWEEGCTSCSFGMDHVDGTLPHLGARDTALIAVSHASLPEIGRSFGGKHHSTVIHSIRKVEDLRKKDTAFNSLMGTFVEGFK